MPIEIGNLKVDEMSFFYALAGIVCAALVWYIWSGGTK